MQMFSDISEACARVLFQVLSQLNTMTERWVKNKNHVGMMHLCSFLLVVVHFCVITVKQLLVWWHFYVMISAGHFESIGIATAMICTTWLTTEILLLKLPWESRCVCANCSPAPALLYSTAQKRERSCFSLNTFSHSLWLKALFSGWDNRMDCAGGKRNQRLSLERGEKKVKFSRLEVKRGPARNRYRTNRDKENIEWQ